MGASTDYAIIRNPVGLAEITAGNIIKMNVRALVPVSGQELFPCRRPKLIRDPAYNSGRSYFGYRWHDAPHFNSSLPRNSSPVRMGVFVQATYNTTGGLGCIRHNSALATLPSRGGQLYLLRQGPLL